MLTFNYMFVTIIFGIFYVSEHSGFSEGKSLDFSNMTGIQNQEENFYLDSSQVTAFDDMSNVKDTSYGEFEPSSKTLEEIEKAFRKKNTPERVERIQSVKSGFLTKSIFIPLLPDDVPDNKSDANKAFEENESDKKSKTILDTTKNFRFVEVSAMKNQTLNLNNTLILKNGKLYKLVKIKKNGKRTDREEILNHQNRKERTFRFLPNLLSILPVQWMTKENKNEALGVESKVENQTIAPKIAQGVEENSSQDFNKSIQSSEKIKKLLNLFTIVAFDNAECYADGLKGYCYHQSECETRGGKFSATCARELGVCCYSQKTCGQKSNENFTYFVHEESTESSQTSQVCMLTVEKAHPDVAQLRLDFISFQLRDPVNGTCLHDRLVVTGQDTSHLVPEICGVNTGQHIYVDVEDTVGPYHLNLITMGEYFPRNFRIKVTQIKKSDQLLSPKNCLQYFTEPFGTIQTFNYVHNVIENIDQISSGYFNNLNYAICIKKLRGFCSISYENEEPDSLQPSFQLTNVDLDGEKLLPPRQAGAETFDCPDDYIVINGIRLCGEKLNDASVEIDFTKNYPVTDTSNGPFIINVRTDAAVSGRGFYLNYRQNPCLV